MPASLAEQLYAAFTRAVRDIDLWPTWEDAHPDHRRAWEAVAEEARAVPTVTIPPSMTLADVARAVDKLNGESARAFIIDRAPLDADTVHEKGDREPSSPTPLPEWPKHDSGDLGLIVIGPDEAARSEIARLQAAVEQLERQRDEAQRAVRDGFPATVAVIRQQRDEAQALADRRNNLLVLIKAETGSYLGAQVHELAKAEAVIDKVDALLRKAAT